MVLPRVSVIWLNYNSMGVMNLTERSLAAIAELDYPDFELVMVDNGSSDGSREVLEKLVEKGFLSSSRVKFIKLAQNLGWTGGINAGYDVRDRCARYVALTHNDLIPRPNYLRELVSFLEKHKDVGAVQGLVTRLGSASEIDSSGFILNETLDLFPLHKSSFFSFCNPVYLSFVEGTMPIYSVDAVRRVLNDDHILFIY